MRILIKGMEMPKDCGTCDLCTGDGECMALYGENLLNYIPDDAEYFPNDWRYEKCPLVEIVTCKDCSKRRKVFTFSGEAYDCERDEMLIDPNKDFCSRGEKNE